MKEDNCTMEIILEDVRFFARHGVFSQENICGNEFAVDLTVEFPVSTADFTDDDERLDSTLSYADLHAIVAEEMGRPRQLLETVGCSIARRVRREFPQMTKGSIKITKITPPIGGFDGSAAIRLRF